MRALIRKKSRLLSFGILATFFSSPGQTFLMAFFIPPMCAELRLSQTEISALFFCGTLASAFLLPLFGFWFDHDKPMRFVLVTGILLTLGCATLGLAQTSWVVLAGFFLVRNFGQGGLAMASHTMMGRLEDEHRGKAMGIANLGYPISEVVLPGVVSSLIVVFGWRFSWMMLAGLVLLVFLPLVPYLIRNEPHPQKRYLAEDQDVLSGFPPRESWTVGRMLRDRSFQLLLLPILVTPGFLSALFFHHIAIMERKSWDPVLLPAGFLFYAVCRAVVSFFSGPLTDRFTARKLFAWNLVPLGAGLAFLWLAKDPFWIFFYFAGAGLTMGFGITVGNALYAELYGTRYLGSIRGVISFAIILATAVAPFLLGYALDRDMNLSAILGGMVIVVIFGTLCAFWALRPSARPLK